MVRFTPRHTVEAVVEARAALFPHEWCQHLDHTNSGLHLPSASLFLSHQRCQHVLLRQSYLLLKPHSSWSLHIQPSRERDASSPLWPPLFGIPCPTTSARHFTSLLASVLLALIDCSPCFSSPLLSTLHCWALSSPLSGSLTPCSPELPLVRLGARSWSPHLMLLLWHVTACFSWELPHSPPLHCWFSDILIHDPLLALKTHCVLLSHKPTPRHSSVTWIPYPARHLHQDILQAL